MASFAKARKNLEIRLEKAISERAPVFRDNGSEPVYSNLKAMPEARVLNVELFNTKKIIASSFLELSKSWMDTMMLISSWVSRKEISTLEYDAIVKYLNRKE
jgi:hypothetical protein